MSTRSEFVRHSTGARAYTPTGTPAGASYETLYRDEHKSLVRLATFTCGRAVDAEAIVHDAFVNLIRRSSPPDNPAAFLRTSVLNATRSRFRRRAVSEKHRPTIVASQDHAESLRFDHLFDLLDRLTPRQRTAVVLRYYEMRSEAEIATLIGCQPGTVKSLLHRALRTMRRELSS